MRTIVLLLSIVLTFTSCSSVTNHDSKGSTIICFGDSLTFGYGAQQGEDYPSVLANLLATPVINAGISGDTTRKALERLERDVLSKNPKLVIIEFGANDFFQKIPKEETKDNLFKMASLIQKKGAMVAIVGVRIGLLFDEYADIFSSVAAKTGAIYVPDILKDISTDPSKKSDELHPNAIGYTIIASRIHKRISRHLQ